MKRRTGAVLVGLGVAAALAAAAYVYSTGRAPRTAYRTARVDRGTIVATVSASGTLAAVTTVLVGSQVSGQIKDVLVDFNSPVRRGQLIARLDPDVFQARVNAAAADLDNVRAQVLNQRANVEKVRADVENARAAAAAAEANVERMRADVENARAMIASARATVAREAATAANARLELERRMDLFQRELISRSERDQAQTAFDTAQAQLEAARAQERAGEAALRSAEAQLEAARAQARAAHAQVASAEAALGVARAQLAAAEATVRQKEAALEQARLDLQHTEIRAPVDGVVVARSVEPGQTVAASLQAPTLFTIAQDLTRMQVEAAVDEADVGRLREGIVATFTVDAFPGRTFHGEIAQIRKAAQVVQNVVTYTTVIVVANPDRILLPGMTANVRIPVDRRDDVVRVPNAALRFRPPGETGRAAAAAAPGDAPDPRELREELVRELGLTAEQQGRLDAILAEARRAPGPVTRDLREEARDRVRAILTPEQRTRFEAWLAARDQANARRGTPARVYVPGPDGEPRPVAVRVGLSDGSYSELVSGDLAPGQEVIVGMPTGSGTRPATSGPRLRF